MCGIAGFWQRREGRKEELSHKILGMTTSLAHRGPDDHGVWINTSAGIALGHQRLSIIDLSPKGRQPMVSRSGRYVITYNGEIYNFPVLRRELVEDGIQFKSTTDTEVILEGIDCWGFEETLKKIMGMFAFAVWDEEEKVLYLARDRVGIKPLFYGKNNDIFFFASELKALWSHPDFEPEIEQKCIPLFLRFDNVPTPYSIYKGIQKLLPGHYAVVQQGEEPSLYPYWDVKKVVVDGIKNPVVLDEEQVGLELEKLLLEAVKMHMMADVPLGGFLSGGVDSSTVVALMQAQSTQPVRTYSIGFFEQDFNEAIFSKKVAKYLGTDHTELYVSPADALEIIPRLPEVYDEPFADYSQIPTLLISQLTRSHVTVALSGDGGDELFGGYPRYLRAPSTWRVLRLFPEFSRHHAGRFIRLVSPTTWDALGSMIKPILPRQWTQLFSGERLYRFADMVGAKDFMSFYRMIMSWWTYPSRAFKNAEEPTTFFDKQQDDTVAGLDAYQEMMLADLITYLPDDILTKVDRASMSIGLEIRVPLLDHRVIEFAWKIPTYMKIRDGRGKRILTNVLHRYVPNDLVQRDKMGFSVPIDTWLRGPLRDWAEHLLSMDRLEREGFFNHREIRDIWMNHLTGQRSLGPLLWPILMFQAWLDRWFK